MKKWSMFIAPLLVTSGCSGSPEERAAACESQVFQYKRNAVCSSISVDAQLYLEDEDPIHCMDSTPSAIAEDASVGMDDYLPHCFEDERTSQRYVSTEEVLQIVASGDCGTDTDVFLQCRRRWSE